MSAYVYRAVGPQPAGRPCDKVKTYPRDRVCGAEGCGTVLSAYNPSSLCSLHIGAESPRQYSFKARPPAACVCEECGVVFQRKNPRRRFCSDRCRMTAFLSRRRETQGSV
jgi:hypothetical protein